MSVRIGFERALAAAPPEQKHPLTIIAAQDSSGIEHCAEQYGAIVVGELDQAGLGNQATKLDQLAGSLAPLHLAISRVGARSLQLKPMPRHRRST